ncbi:MAG: putative nicotinate-nucleotide adenylyltransferase [Porticoccaceae bacterium]|nr:MAG: putative nicotinate-nucleotide adenylyltransferase [Porticoccaceae bacterium]
MAIGVFGGTFDPVHIGHLRLAVELLELVPLRRMLLVPAADPPHRERPHAAARHRLAMLSLAVAGEPRLAVDRRELDRPGPSYTYDTLASLRAELGPAEPLCLCLGLDAFAELATWHRWRELAELAHLVVAARPGAALPRAGPLASWLGTRRAPADALHRRPAGLVHLAAIPLLPVSATELRRRLAAGRSVRYLTPDPVIDYIRAHGLYGADPSPEVTPP